MVHILIVEDESIVAEDIQNSLQRMGYAICGVASSGKEALQLAKDLNPDLVLMDIVLKGGIDGIETAETIRTQNDIPVVYLTAHADKKTLERAKITEPYGYLMKPIEDTELHTTIEMAVYKHKTEKKVQETEQWLSTVLNSIGDGVIATDIQGTITFMNPVAEQLTGYTHTEAVGTPLHKVFCIMNEKTRIPCENPVEIILETGGVMGLANNTVLIAKDGSERLIADSGTPIQNNHQVLGTVIIFRDVTEKRKMEEDLIQLKTEKIESVSVLAGGIAHDFNNILTAILGNITLARLHSAPETEVYKTLIEAEKASLRAKNLTQQLLLFSKEGSPVKQTTSVPELVKCTAEFALSGSNAQCIFHMPYGVWPVEADAGQISQVISNLIINAEQAMPKGGTITIKTENITVTPHDGIPLPEGNYVKIAVLDEGIGIPQEHISRIYDPYFTTKQKGSGLGLATSYSIVKNHGGFITVESELGMGTIFYIYLPASDREIPTEEKSHHIVRSCKGKVLLMDDEESVLEPTKETLAYLGYEVVKAIDGVEAVELYRNAHQQKEPFDVVIVDLTVRGRMGGTETIEKLLEIDPHVTAIVSSGYCNHPVLENFAEHGFKGVITKPYTIDELSETLHTILMGE
jgi:two-component system cell cycle sensor histidine kinase/response regulator CckA